MRFLRLFVMTLLCWPLLATAANTTMTVAIKGMTCPLCVAAVNKALRTTPGVVSAKTFLSREEAEVTVPEGLDPAIILAAIEDAGYTGTIMPSARQPQEAARLDPPGQP